ncbi:hypothetical protein OIU34_22825 [Pararhizobium sp. BT-229]|uniref:hypothetical protein n=1 Tax=Pararhizobium sp. BT-229 TaxID=2986923 RepID=UPI0021F76456|nr:hypothetical protein [Pararhizobium sp. BT-229]MCV9964729.1 hypothetical protein [Pararhizobium sp. BT-229]
METDGPFLKPHPEESLKIVVEEKPELFPKRWFEEKLYFGEISEIEAVQANPEAEAARRGFSIPPISPA